MSVGTKQESADGGHAPLMSLQTMQDATCLGITAAVCLHVLRQVVMVVYFHSDPFFTTCLNEVHYSHCAGRIIAY